jgi:hypothetical protein
MERFRGRAKKEYGVGEKETGKWRERKERREEREREVDTEKREMREWEKGLGRGF